MRESPNTSFGCEKPKNGETHETGSLIQKTRVFIPLLLALVALPAKAENMPLEFEASLSPNLPRVSSAQVQPDESELSGLLKPVLSSPEPHKSIDWGKLQENLHLMNSVSNELDSKSEEPSIPKIGDELMGNKPLSHNSAKRLTDLMNKYKVSDFGKAKKLLGKKKLSLKNRSFLKAKMIEITEAQRKTILFSRAIREWLSLVIDTAIENTGKIKLSPNDLAMFKGYGEKIESDVKKCGELLYVLDKFEQDLQ
jgi:hypothetical protein